MRANDTCIQCHSQGQPLTNPIQGQYYDWPVGFHQGGNLKDFWKLEEHKLGETTFTHFADGTAHKNRMQGNDFVQSVMYRRGVTCFSCHDVHGTSNNADLVKPSRDLCLTCHSPTSPNGPRGATLEEHTHHARGSAGSECVGCHMPAIEPDNRQRERAQPHLRVHHAGHDRRIQGAQSVHHLPHRSIDRVGASDTSGLVERFAVASRVADGGRIIRRH